MLGLELDTIQAVVVNYNSRFHGITAVAGLKLTTSRKLGQRGRTFHGITAVAELKRARRPHFYLRVALVFHGITAVAELKGSSSSAAVIEQARCGEPP